MKYHKKFLCSSLLFMILIPYAISDSYVKYCFVDGVTLQSATNVNVNGWICESQSCNNPTGSMWSGLIVNSNSAPPTNCVTWKFPTTLQGSGYTLILFSEGYKTKFIATITTTDRNNPGTTEAKPLNYPYNPIKLNKQADCSSPVSLSVVNNIRENLPVSITSGANLDATTKSAIGSTNKAWFPQTMRYYFEVETTLRLKVYKYDVANSKNIGTPIHVQNVVKRIYYDDTVSVAFADWMPPAQTTQFTYYNVTVVSDVTDPKCSSKVNQAASKIMRVWRDDPKNECYSLVDSSGLLFTPVSSTQPQAGQEVTISFRKLSNYANNYEPWESLYKLTPTDTNIRLKLTGPETKNIDQTIIKNPNENFKDVTVKWTPLKSGTYTVNIIADSINYACPKDTASDPLIGTLIVYPAPKYDF